MSEQQSGENDARGVALPTLAESYRVYRGGIDIDGLPFPWHVSADPGPRVERVSEVDDMHILWMPVLVDAVLLPEEAAQAPLAGERPEVAPEGHREDESAREGE